MCVGSCGAFYLFGKKGNKDSVKKEGRRSEPDSNRRLSGFRASEIEPQTELHTAWIVRARQVHEGCASKGSSRLWRWHGAVYAIKLRVIEEVERFPAEFEPGALIDREALESAEVEVDASGQIQGVAPYVAEGEAGWNGKGIGVIEHRSGLAGILIGGEAGAGVADQIGARARSGPVSHTGIITKISSVRHSERQPCLCHCDALNRPVAEGLIPQSRALEDWKGVDVAE